MLKLAGECIEGQLAEHEASIDAHTRNLFQSFMVGSYCIGIPVRATANYAINANYLRTVPFIAARDITIDRIAIQVYSAAASGEKARLGIYKNKSDDEPGPDELLLDAGEVTVDSTGLKAITIDQELVKGIYHLAVVSNGNPTPRVYLPAWNPRGQDSTYYEAPITMSYRDFTYAALPDPFGGTILDYYSGSAGVLVRVASLG